jgi:hypothetical protein
MKYLIKDNKNVFILFLVLFVVFCSETYMRTSEGSNTNVEQWVNITNQMFYGSNDFMFSYGPLYWIMEATSPYSMQSAATVVVFISLIKALSTTIIGTLVIKKSSYIYAVLIYCLFIHSIVPVYASFLLPLLILFFIEYYNEKPINLNLKHLIVIAIYIGVSFYIRYLYGVIGLATIGGYLIGKILFDRSWRSAESIKKIFIFSISVIITFIFCGIIIFHHPGHVIDYVIINNQLSFGNSVDMTLQIHNPWFTWLMVFICYLCLLIYCLKYKKTLLVPVTLIFLILFKLGFSRADHYYGYFIVPSAILGIITTFNKTLLSRVLSIFIILSLFIIANYGWSPRKNFVASVNYQQPYIDRMQSVYKGNFTLPDKIIKKIGSSTVDTYPTNNEYIFANKLNYVHRPSFQSYMTLTPKLDEMNQDFLESSSRPDFIIWNASSATFGGFDCKYGLNEDPLTSSTIFLNYHIVDVCSDSGGRTVVILQKNNKVTIYSQTLLEQQSMIFGQWYNVPKVNKGVIKLIPNFKFTALGKLKNLLFRGSIVTINYKFKDGTVSTYRLNILNSYSGIWVSPHMNNIESQSDVISIKINSNARYYIESSFKSSWITVPITTPFDKGVNLRELLSPVSLDLGQYTKLPTTDVKFNVDSFSSNNDLLDILGWAYIKNINASNTKAYIKLYNSKHSYIYKSNLQNRVDVGKAFQDGKNLQDSGFNISLITNGLKGKYSVDLIMVNGSNYADVYTGKYIN